MMGETAFTRRFKSCKIIDAITSDVFTTCLCDHYKGRKKLKLHGQVLSHKYGRRLCDSDVSSLLEFLENNQDITSLDLSYNRITSSGFKALLSYLAVHKHIYELNIQNNDIQQNGTYYMKEIKTDLRIRKWHLNGNKLGDQGSINVALFMLNNPYVTYLNVAQVWLTATSIAYFTTILRPDKARYNYTLRVLDISRPNSGYNYSYDVTHVANIIGCMLKHNVSLIELYLQKYGFSCHDIEVMVLNARYNNTLHLIDLGSNNIGDHGMSCLCRWINRKPTLKVLILSHNIITDHGARDLMFSLPMSRLTSLDLSYNKITDTTAVGIFNSLKKTPCIRHLRMFGNIMTDPTAKIVQRILMAKVLLQKNIDIKPYKVDCLWHLAKYPGDFYEDKCIY